jgi:cytochrome bd ubiquinol oxidase subunit I
VLSFAGYIVAYLIMFPAGVLLMARIVRRNLEAPATEGPIEGGRPDLPVITLPGARRGRAVVMRFTLDLAPFPWSRL